MYGNGVAGLSDRGVFYRRAEIEEALVRLEAEQKALEAKIRAFDVEMNDCDKRLVEFFSKSEPGLIVPVYSSRIENEYVIRMNNGLVCVEPLTPIDRVGDEKPAGGRGSLNVTVDAEGSYLRQVAEESPTGPDGKSLGALRAKVSRPLPSDDVEFDGNPCIAERRASVGHPAELVAMGRD